MCNVQIDFNSKLCNERDIEMYFVLLAATKSHSRVCISLRFRHEEVQIK